MQKENLPIPAPSCGAHEPTPNPPPPPPFSTWMNTDPQTSLCILSPSDMHTHTDRQTHLEPHPQHPVWESSIGPLAEPPPLLHEPLWSISVLFNNFRIKSCFSAVSWVAKGGA